MGANDAQQTNEQLLQQAQAWLDQDPDPNTAEQLRVLIEQAPENPEALSELNDCFNTRLAFGTAGLRGALGPGPNRMNRVLVMQAAAGLAAYLNERTGQTNSGGAVVIGYDARHNSDVFARDTAAVMTGAGLSAMVLPEPLPTPVLAYAIRELGCVAGVMVTASHNPPQDNGYKVYLGDGSQIIPPADAEIAAHIDRVAASMLISDIPVGDEWVTLNDDVTNAYITATAQLIENPPATHARVVYSAMHGVGGRIMNRVCAKAAFPVPAPVDLQFDPDPDFPTVAFPNPEEPGAIDLSLIAARENDADIVIANDPDADRCAVAIPIGETDDEGMPGWRMLRGDEVGSLLAWWIIQRAKQSESEQQQEHAPVMAQSLVSGQMLQSIAAAAGIEYRQTLTGFKWIGRIPGLVYGYEEALGYCVDPQTVKDKDGISAALLVIEMASHLKSEGRTLQSALDDLEMEHGVFATDQVSARVRDLADIPRIMNQLRSDPPSTIGGIAVEEFVDLELGSPELPPTDGLLFRLAGGARVIVRPSGTEPKVKCYLQAVAPVTGTDLAGARASAQVVLSTVASEVRGWLQ
jgi:phosphomannomutase